MSAPELNIHFSLHGQLCNVGLTEVKQASSQNQVTIGGIHYSLQGDQKGLDLVKKCLAQLPHDSMQNLAQTEHELNARLWLEGAKEISSSSAGQVHRLGVGILGHVHPIDIHQSVNRICEAMEKEYVFPEIGKKCSDFLRKQLQEGAYDAIHDPTVFVSALTADLRLISEDKHITVELISKKNTPEKTELNEIQTEESMPDPFVPELIHSSSYLAPSNIGWMGREIGTLPYELQVGFLAQDPKVGYMDIRVFGVCNARGEGVKMEEDVQARRQAYQEAVQHVKSAESIIIDLRNNGGGDPFAVQLLCSLFIEEKAPLNRIERRTPEGPKSEDFNTLTNEELPKESRALTQPIYILIGPFTFSAAEEFSNNMKVLNRATIVGEPSGGGANPGAPYQINEEISIFIPTGRAFNPIQEGNWEGVGVIPDHVVPEAEALDKAISLIH